MSSTHGKCSLYLCPQQHDFTVTDISTLVTALREISLISERLASQEPAHRYYSGDKFLDYIAYMGCAPAIQFEAGNDNEDFCFIKLHQYDPAKLIHSRTQSRAPHCPGCNKPVRNWQQGETKTTIHCDLCDTTSGIEKFDWRKVAGYAQLFIEVTDVFPKEAVPQQLILDKLSSITKTDWLYFYSCQ